MHVSELQGKLSCIMPNNFHASKQHCASVPSLETNSQLFTTSLNVAKWYHGVPYPTLVQVTCKCLCQHWLKTPTPSKHISNHFLWKWYYWLFFLDYLNVIEFVIKIIISKQQSLFSAANNSSKSSSIPITLMATAWHVRQFVIIKSSHVSVNLLLYCGKNTGIVHLKCSTNRDTHNTSVFLTDTD